MHYQKHAVNDFKICSPKCSGKSIEQRIHTEAHGPGGMAQARHQLALHEVPAAVGPSVARHEDRGVEVGPLHEANQAVQCVLVDVIAGSALCQGHATNTQNLKRPEVSK